MAKSLNISIFGASGRMGSNLIELIQDGKEFELGTIIARNQAQNSSHNKFPEYKYGNIDSIKTSDVIIDFSSNEGLNFCLEAAKKHGVPLLSGTTSLSKEVMDKMQEYANYIPIFHSNNMSIGIAVLKELAKKAAILLGDEYDIEINELHHRHKKDAPSGTALMLGKSICSGLNISLNDVKHVYEESPNQIRQKGQIGFNISRGGGVIGDHSVSFISEEEEVKLSHRAFDRKLFARASLSIAKWIIKQPNGFYIMDDYMQSMLKI